MTRVTVFADAMLGYVLVEERWQGGAYSYGVDHTLREFGRESSLRLSGRLFGNGDADCRDCQIAES